MAVCQAVTCSRLYCFEVFHCSQARRCLSLSSFSGLMESEAGIGPPCLRVPAVAVRQRLDECVWGAAYLHLNKGFWGSACMRFWGWVRVCLRASVYIRL